MLLVTKGKTREWRLGYDKKTKEYVCYHYGKEQWREKGDDSLLNYFNEVRTNYRFIDDREIAKLPTANIWKRYSTV